MRVGKVRGVEVKLVVMTVAVTALNLKLEDSGEDLNANLGE